MRSNAELDEEAMRHDGAAHPRAARNDVVTEDYAAKVFVERHGENLRYCHSTGAWFRWNARIWAREETGLAFHWARELARHLAEDQDAHKRVKNGLLKPACVLAATEEYFSDQDLFAHWLAEECIADPGNMDRSETSSRLFKSWREFAAASGSTPGTQQSFKDQMIRHGFKFFRSRKVREFFGISFRTRDERDDRDGFG